MPYTNALIRTRMKGALILSDMANGPQMNDYLPNWLSSSTRTLLRLMKPEDELNQEEYNSTLLCNFYYLNSTPIRKDEALRDNNAAIHFGSLVGIYGYIENLLREILMYENNEITYIDPSRYTLKTLLSTDSVTEVIGSEIASALEYSLLKNQNGVGENLRNRLCHFDQLSRDELSNHSVFIAFYYLLCVVNTMLHYYIGSNESFEITEEVLESEKVNRIND